MASNGEKKETSGSINENSLKENVYNEFASIKISKYQIAGMMQKTALLKKRKSSEKMERLNQIILIKLKTNNPIFNILHDVARKVSNSEKNISSHSSAELRNYNRKEKSLEELTKRFLGLFCEKEETMISLYKITSQLGIERRRIYDIINILESMNLVSRSGKNKYKWNGFSKVFETIKEYEIHSEIDLDNDDVDTSSKPEVSAKREKSLEKLSIGFLKLFLHWKKSMSLEEAAQKLSSPNSVNEHKLKTKIRRLYDIANVFKSLGLIKKTTLEKKKPGFEWVGLEGINAFLEKIKTEGIKFDDDGDFTKLEENENFATSSEDDSCFNSKQDEESRKAKVSKLKKKEDINAKIGALLETDVKKPLLLENRLKTVKKPTYAERAERDKFSNSFQSFTEKTIFNSLSILMGIRPFSLSQSTQPSESELDASKSFKMDVEDGPRSSKPATLVKETLTIIPKQETPEKRYYSQENKGCDSSSRLGKRLGGSKDELFKISMSSAFHKKVKTPKTPRTPKNGNNSVERTVLVRRSLY